MPSCAIFHYTSRFSRDLFKTTLTYHIINIFVSDRPFRELHLTVCYHDMTKRQNSFLKIFKDKCR